MSLLIRQDLILMACVSAIAFTETASAATGGITVNVNASPGTSFTKTSNISGPTFTSGTHYSFTATFASLTNTSGSITADMTSNNYESLCYSTFTTVVSNGTCKVVPGAQSGGQGKPACTYQLNNVNPQTCDFTATFSDVAGTPTGIHPPPPN